MIDITEVKVKVITNKTPLLAFAKIVLNDALAIEGIKIIQGKDNTFIAMPSTKVQKGDKVKYYDKAFPINKETREQIEEAVLSKYVELIK